MVGRLGNDPSEAIFATRFTVWAVSLTVYLPIIKNIL